MVINKAYVKVIIQVEMSHIDGIDSRSQFASDKWSEKELNERGVIRSEYDVLEAFKFLEDGSLEVVFKSILDNTVTIVRYDRNDLKSVNIEQIYIPFNL